MIYEVKGTNGFEFKTSDLLEAKKAIHNYAFRFENMDAEYRIIEHKNNGQSKIIIVCKVSDNESRENFLDFLLRKENEEVKEDKKTIYEERLQEIEEEARAAGFYDDWEYTPKYDAEYRQLFPTKEFSDEQTAYNTYRNMLHFLKTTDIPVLTEDFEALIRKLGLILKIPMATVLSDIKEAEKR